MKNDYITNKPWDKPKAIQARASSRRRYFKVLLSAVAVLLLACVFVGVYQQKNHIGFFKPVKVQAPQQVKIPLTIPNNSKS